MLQTLIDNLTTEQRKQLAEFGLLTQTITDMKAGRRLPTEIQVIAIAAVCGVDRHTLQDEVTLLRAKPEQRKLLERLMSKATGMVAMVACGLAVVMALAVGSNGAVPGRLFSKR